MERTSKRRERVILAALQPLPARICQRIIFALVVLVALLAPLTLLNSLPWLSTVIEALIALAGFIWVVRTVSLRHIKFPALKVLLPLGCGVIYGV